MPTGGSGCLRSRKTWSSWLEASLLGVRSSTSGLLPQFPKAELSESTILSPRPKIKTRLFRRVFILAGRAGFEPATELPRHSLSRRAHSATLAPPRVHLLYSVDSQRREWDSNPRWCDPNMFSRHAPSAARPSLHVKAILP